MLRCHICRWLLLLLTAAGVIWPSDRAVAEAASPEHELFTDQPKGLSEKIAAWKFSYTGEFLDNITGGLRPGFIYEGLANLGAGVNLQKLAGWDGAVFYASAIQLHGLSLTQHYSGDFNVASNIDTTHTFRLYELWLQQNLDDDHWSLRIGQMAADKELFISDGGSLYMNSAFGSHPVVYANLNALYYPLSAPGFRVRWAPSDEFSLLGMIYSGDWGTPETNPHNTDWSFSGQRGVLEVLEATIKTNQGKDATGLPGVFKLGVFHDSASFVEPGDQQRHQGDSGFYAIADQMIYRASGSKDDAVKGLKSFARAGWAPQADRNTLVFDAEAGLNYAGPFPSRDADIAGVGFVLTQFGQSYLSQNPGAQRHESIIEATYLMVINEHWSLQPDFQYIIHPGRAPDLKDAFVAGFRFTLTF